MEKITIRKLAFDNVTMDEALAKVEGYIERGEQCVVFTPNAEIVQMTMEDGEFRGLVQSADILTTVIHHCDPHKNTTFFTII